MAQKKRATVLDRTPNNWGRWGKEDQIGALNYIGNREILEAAKSIRVGKVFTLGLRIGSPGGDPVFPSRTKTNHMMVRDQSDYSAGKIRPLRGGGRYADDVVFMYLQGTTHVDALGHFWRNDRIYNRFNADSTIGGLSKASVESIANKGIVGRGVLLDVARYLGVRQLKSSYLITLRDLKNTASHQGTEIKPHDILLIRTGYIRLFYEKGEQAYFDNFKEPGISYTEELANWFYSTEISAFGADTLSSEQSPSSTVDADDPMHHVLLYRLGIPIQEMLWLEDLAADCERDKRHDFFYAASALKFYQGTGSPINPIAVK